jgi:exosortase
MKLTSRSGVIYYHRKMKRSAPKYFMFLLFSIIAIWMAYLPLRALLLNTKEPEYYSHIPLIPIISAYFIFRKKKEIFGRSDSLYFPGMLVMTAGVLLLFFGRTLQANVNDHASLASLSALVFESGSLAFVYGKEALREACFPLALLAFAIPLPSLLMGWAISALVAASSAVTHVLFKAIGVPVIRESPIFYLPCLNLKVTHECSSIRSSLALFITAILAGHIFLRTFAKKAVLALAVVPVAILKNGLRIVSIYLLSVFIDMRFIEGDFHHKFAGSVFFVVGLVMLAVVLWLLRRTERA